jgi:membrane protease YdiL (CAAX protease family)
MTGSTASYIDTAPGPHGRWWNYLLGLIFVLASWLFVGGIATAGVLVTLLKPDTPLTALSVEQLSTQGPYTAFLVVMAAYPFFLAGMLLTPPIFHRRSPRTLITAAPAINWGRVALGFGVWTGIQVLFTLLGYLLDPAGLALTFDAATFAPFAVMAVCLVPLQTTAEELFFRGYLVQWASLLSRNRLFLIVLSAVIFTLPHLANPEVRLDVPVMVAQYFALGAFFAWISLRDGTLELAIGVHAANNLFAVLMVNYPGSALPSPSVFATTTFEPLPSLIWLLIGIAVFYLTVYGWPRRRPALV